MRKDLGIFGLWPSPLFWLKHNQIINVNEPLEIIDPGRQALFNPPNDSGAIDAAKVGGLWNGQ